MDQHVYRPDIDGLRALAIIPVVLFHADLAGFSGGFVGVDIFFVISGFLITSIILRDIEKGQFTYRNFWARRARRILPALFTVVLFSIVVGWFILMPRVYEVFGKSAALQSVFWANMHFLKNAGYFAAPAQSQPLLHTWSLAVEEQFYLFFPLLLVLATRFIRSKRLILLLLILAASLLMNLWLVGSNATAAFYLFPTRAWELLIGSVIALTLFESAPSSKELSGWIVECGAVLGVGLIVYAVIAFDQNTLFPGSAALVPTIGAGLLIYTNGLKQTVVSRVLSFRPLVWVGLISYSLYLWHWPLLTFAKYSKLTDLTHLELLIVIMASFIMAWLSYVWVETPIRNQRLFRRQRTLFIASIAVLITMAGLGRVIYKNHGFVARLPVEVNQLYTQAREYYSGCRLDELCEHGAASASPAFLLWGDSHAHYMLPVIDQLAKENELNYVTRGCVPVLDTFNVGRDQSVIDSTCANKNRQLIEYLKETKIPDVIIMARWALYTDGYNSKRGVELLRKDPFYGDSEIHAVNPEQSQGLFKKHFTATVEQLTALGVRVWIMAQVPEHLVWVPDDLALLSMQGGDIEQMGRPLSEHLERQAFVNSVFKEIKGENVTVLDPTPYFCAKNNRCKMALNGRSLYRDDDHLSIYGASQLRPLFKDIFAGFVTQSE